MIERIRDPLRRVKGITSYVIGLLRTLPGYRNKQVVIGDMGKVRLVWTLRKLYRGTHVICPMVSVRPAKSIQVDSVDRLLLQAGGELLGEAPASFSILPAALNVVIR